MTEGSRGFILDLVNTTRDGLKTMVEAILKTMIVWLVVLGLVFAVLFIRRTHEPYTKVLELLATILLAAGAFEGIVKSMEFSGLYKKQLMKVFDDPDFVKKQKLILTDIMNSPETLVYVRNSLNDSEVTEKQRSLMSEVVMDDKLLERQRDIVLDGVYNPTFLKGRSDLEEIWKRISRIVYEKSFPEISELIANRVLTDYFPKKDNFYYDKFVENMQIDFCEDMKHIHVRSTLNFKIKAMDASQKIIWKYGNEIQKEAADTETRLELEVLRVNFKDMKSESNLKVETIDGGKQLRLSLSLELEHKSEYDVMMIEDKIYDPAVDSIKDFTSTRFINTLELNVAFPFDKLDVLHSPVGVDPSRLEYPNPDAGPNVSYFYRDLLFPNQGYRLVLRRR